jgi:tetratricopeptide (TPR) repeat protein
MKELNPEMLELADNDPIEAARLQQAMEALAPSSMELPAAFNASLRAAITAPPARSAPRAHLRYASLLGYAATLAAGLLLGSLFFSSSRAIDPLGASVSWAQVVQAVEMVSHFHATFFADEPRNNPDSGLPSLYRIDWYYQQPGLCRAQGLGHVHFTNGKENRLFSIKEGAWVDPKEAHLNFAVTELGGGIKMSDFLSIVLARMFHDKAPTGEPVINSDLTAAGIEVFDYVTSPGAEWARIWVLKASRMPLRIKVFEPQQDSSLLIEFDYTDPQPPAFFDPAAFESGVHALGSHDAARIYSIGAEPLAGKPTGAAQINGALGGYHAPTIRRAVSNADGDIALITSIPLNVSPTGRSPLEQGYQSITDNWGNRYLQIGASSGIRPDGDAQWYFSPTPPLKTGNGARQVTAQFMIRTAENGPAGIKTLIVATQTANVADVSIPVQKEDWTYSNFADVKARALKDYFRGTAALPQQLAAVEAALAKDPASLDALLWKVTLYRQYGREDQAWKLFEKSLRDRLLADPALFFTHDINITDSIPDTVAQYMIYLAHNDRWSDFGALAPKIEKLRDDGLASANLSIRQRVQSMFKSEANLPAYLIRQVLAIPACRAALRDNPPAFVKTLAAKDGMVCVQLRVPVPPDGWNANGHSSSESSSGERWSISAGWCWTPDPLDKAWQVVGQFADTRTGDVWVALAPLKNAGPSIKLGNTVQIIRDNYEEGHSANAIEFPWSVTTSVPAATIESMEIWWRTNTQGKNAHWIGLPMGPSIDAPPSPVDGWLKEAGDLHKARRFDEAAALYRRIATAPTSAWPASYAEISNDPYLLVNARRDAQAAAVQVLVDAGRLDEARQEIEKLRADLPPAVDLLSCGNTRAHQIARKAQLALIRTLIANGKRTEAQAALDQIARERPDLSLLSNETQMVSTGPGSWTSVNYRQLQRDAWREYDTAWWNAQESSSSDAPKP